MKRLVGGDYLLDLTPIDIEESVDAETYTNITNTEVIAQLTNLKKYISNPSMIKPVWVKLKNSETDELVVARGELKVVGDGEFEIVVQLDGYKLKIHVEFTQVLNGNNDPLDDWFIDTNDAKYLFTSDAQNIEKLIDDGDLKLYEDIDIADAITFSTGGLPDLEITKGYCKLRKTKENELYIVLNFSIKNNGANAVNLLNNISASITLPSEIAKEIIDCNGNSVNDALENPAGISILTGASDSGYPTAGFNAFKIMEFTNGVASNVTSNQLRDGGTISAGATHNFSFRLFLTL